MAKHKFIPDKFILQLLNNDAIKRGYNQVIEPSAFDRIPDAHYPITLTTLHGDGAMVRCQLVLNNKGDTILLDIDIAKFDALPGYDTETGELSEAD